jgi:tetratricopeptide (TPR) repeat protein
VSRAVCLQELGRPDEALAEAEQAVRIKPRDGHAWNTYGNALQALSRDEEARAAFHFSAALEPRSSTALMNLAQTYGNEGDPAQAVPLLEEAVRRDPNRGKPRCVLGITLFLLDRREEGLAEARRAVELEPEIGSFRSDYAGLLRKEGRFAEGLEQAKEALRLAEGTPREERARFVLRQLETCVSSGDRLQAVVTGKAKPKDVEERVFAAHYAHWTSRYASSAEQWALALKEKPGLQEDRMTMYDAACAAARAGWGSGPEASRLDAKTLASFRARALAWMKITFALERAAIAKGDAGAIAHLQWWKSDPDFRGLRDEAAIAALPEGERPDWWAIWSEVRHAAGPWKPERIEVVR